MFKMSEICTVSLVWGMERVEETRKARREQEL